MRTSSERFSIAANAQKLDVDHRITLRYYYRIGNNLLKQADIFRGEKNFIDLYIMLLRFSSLITETIPHHRDYKRSLQREKLLYKKRLLDALGELEVLKPAVEQRIEELNRKHTSQLDRQVLGHRQQKNSCDLSLDWLPVKNQPLENFVTRKAAGSAVRGVTYSIPRIQQDNSPFSRPGEEQFRKFSLSIPRPKEETLSRHSILGPTGLRGQWQPPISNTRVQYPSNLDLTPVEISINSLEQSLQDEAVIEKDSTVEVERSTLESVLSLNVDSPPIRADEPSSLISFDITEPPVQINIIRQPSPPPVLADVQDLIPSMSPQVTESGYGLENVLPDELARTKSLLQLHISTAMMETFLRLASSNTDKNLESCGILAGSLVKKQMFLCDSFDYTKAGINIGLGNGIFYIFSYQCQATNEEEIFDVQDKQSLFPLGWIHTHPSQSCFMSSIDVHTHYSYQIMLPEAVAIVMAPRDSSRTHGIFRLTTPDGMSIIRKCPQRGFHSHEQPSDGGPIYDHCTDVYMNPKLKFDVIDLR
ncbi:hypothetical protein GIB67_012575 [Kingdonia uniflora]|uniref:MPN domain-containing protein n=1 Tax=Kingdonia uniflora TaxID=39325 RepID=A0A7J7NFM7_9MAGN|nr:hypothetical protein GIB67_012575 [Kingdonia uniflora]